MLKPSPQWDDEIVQLSVEIASYLSSRAGAADTLDGLVSWWLFRQRLEHVEVKVRTAVEYLVKQQLIEKRALADGSVLYIAKTERGEVGTD